MQVAKSYYPNYPIIYSESKSSKCKYCGVIITLHKIYGAEYICTACSMSIDAIISQRIQKNKIAVIKKIVIDLWPTLIVMPTNECHTLKTCVACCFKQGDGLCPRCMTSTNYSITCKKRKILTSILFLQEIILGDIGCKIAIFITAILLAE
jgi:hypothetical protein